MDIGKTEKIHEGVPEPKPMKVMEPAPNPSKKEPAKEPVTVRR